MNLRNLLGKNTLLGSAALGAAVVLVAPSDTAEGFNLLGHTLGQSQRDFRIYNNFNDTQANNNTTVEANFPGYTGAVLAIWKGCVEWGSGPHGDGSSSDNSQSNIGDGGANFDPSFQGENDQIDTGSGNTHSKISGSSGGTFAFMTGGSNGWRIRYYEGWTWADGPGSIGGSNADLQGIGCHEYGHAIGMAHSGSGGATMFASTGTGVTGTRSISNDDSLGVQAAYGVKSASKPEITSVGVAGGVVTVTGVNFAATGNEAWFTQAGIGGNGNPIKVTGLSSTGGGTQISVAVPVNAGDGDLLIRSASGGAGLSNAFPIDVDGQVPPDPFSVTGYSPNPLPSLSATNAQTFSISGTQFSAVTDVILNGESLGGIPASWTSNGLDTISFDLKPLATYGITTTGTYELEVVAAQGTESLMVDIVGADPPALRIGTGGDPEIAISAFPTDVVMGGTPDNIMFLWASLNLGFTPFPGLFDLEIGNFDYGSIVFVAALAVGADGNVTAKPKLSASLAGTTIYWEAVEYDPISGALPAPTTNAGASLVLF